MVIAKLTGVVDVIEEDYMILDVGGVGYLIYCPTNVLSSLRAQQQLTLMIEMVVKEDSLSLYGFIDNTQKKWFKLLQTIQGVGARMALAIMSVLTPDQLANAILAQDYNALKKVSGVGVKLASRIINELQNKEVILLSHNLRGISGDQAEVGCSISSDILRDALSALSNLGFNRGEVYKVLNDILQHNPELDLENLIKQGLSKMTRNE